MSTVLARRAAELTGDRVVLANGTTRLQLDIVSSAALPFHTLFSSQLLGLTKVRAGEISSLNPSPTSPSTSGAFSCSTGGLKRWQWLPRMPTTCARQLKRQSHVPWAY